MPLINFNSLDFDQIKTSLREVLKSSTDFTDYDFEGSNLSSIIDLLAYNTYITSYNANMVANEVFIDSATLRENVVALAKNIGYTPRSRKASKCNVNFFVDPTNLGTSPTSAVRRIYTYTATAGQTTFSGASSEGSTLAYVDQNYIDVYLNGILLNSADYTATSGSSVVLGSGASVSDILTITVYDVFGVADTVSKKDGGTFDGNVTMGGTLSVTGNTTLSGDLSVSGALTGTATSLTEQATTSGTAKDFTVPTTTKVIYITYEGVSFSGSNDDFLIQLGDSGGIETSGYVSTSSATGGGAGAGTDAVATSTAGFAIFYSAGAGSSIHGLHIIANGGGNKFFMNGQARSGNYVSNSSGSKELSGAITTVRVTTANARTFDAGAVNVTYIT